MSRRGNCLDNAAMESWFSTAKAELGETFESIGHGKEQLFNFFYNQRRWHSTLDYSSPARCGLPSSASRGRFHNLSGP